MVKNNRSNDKDLREGLAEKARLTAQETAHEEVLEAEREARDAGHEHNGEPQDFKGH